ncbi:putative amidohydrolase [Fulvivirga imtechensis AK7]|uniref:Putative amidohydrolase n=1 Tax=Fulvivirga imtechensis AK7 TaxID=1237149 RepID=L8JYN1_9BACT|nr:amidohydrolase family protein [Fulvivirga imtechensis]ELR72302.1 putative amidohydrolase [Fulvivirga imtechensis AK7]
MKNIKNIFNCLFLLLAAASSAISQSAKGKEGTFALTNATLVTVTNGTIEKGMLIIQEGKIAALGNTVAIPEGAEVVDCNGLYIYPGMIEGGARLGLTEVGSDARTRDYNEIGDVIPQMQALTAVNPNSVLIPVTRVSGVTTSLAMPTGGLLPGTAALINLHGYTPEQMYAGFQAVVLNFPTTGKRSRWDSRSDEEIKKDAEKALKQLNDVWRKAVSYYKLDSAINATKSDKKLEYYPEMEALLPVVRGERALLVEVNAANDIKAAIEWVKDKNLKVIFSGVSEGWRMAEELAEAKIPVITGPVLNIPNRDYDRYDRAYTNPVVMQKAGVKVAIRTADAENVRNLPYNAGFAAAYGMDKEQALRAITIIPAEIFGVADQLGSLEVGKSATLFVADGDPFETKTQVKHVFIEGWKIPLISRQTRLYDEFLERQPGLKK